MTNRDNIDLDYLLNNRVPKKMEPVKERSKRHFYGQDCLLPNRMDILTWTIVFLGIVLGCCILNSETLNPTNIKFERNIAAEESV